MLRIGNVVILIIPGEMTTMAGRRMRYVLSLKDREAKMLILCVGMHCVRG